MARFPRPYLNGEVEMTGEREHHIAERHPDLLPGERIRIAETLVDPDLVRRSERFGKARLFSRWYNALHGGKHVVVVVVTEGSPMLRNWIVTAYISCNLAEGETEWKRD